MSASGNIFTFTSGPSTRATPGAPSPIPATGVIVDIDVNIGLLGVAVVVLGTYVGTLAVEVSLDARGTWQQIDTITSQQITKVYPFLQTAPSITTDFRVRGAMWTSGVALVQIIPWTPPSVPTIVGSGNQQQLVHAPDTFHSIAATLQGNTLVWQPAAGKRFRLLNLWIRPTQDTTFQTQGDSIVDLRDNNTSIGLTTSFYLPQNTPAIDYPPFIQDLGPIGYLSTAANNPLNLNINGAPKTGNVRCVVMGTEE